MENPKPAAFLSYVHADDEHDDGRISEFRKQLSAEIRMQIGEDFSIFQDRDDIAWGQNWQARIDETLDTVTLLIPIMTPGFFASAPCRKELSHFLERELQLGRSDLILPVYYVSAPRLDDEIIRKSDPLATMLFARQYADWRELRFEPFTAPVIRKALAELAKRMRGTFWLPPQRGGQREQSSATTSTRSVKESPSDEVRRSSVTKNEPPTHVVDQLYRGHFSTITAAINAARAGDRILVRPGLYQENLVLDKPLEIIGQGSVEEIVIQAQDATVLLFKSNIGRVTNLTLRQFGGKEPWHGVDITQGRLELEGCDITSRSGACISIHDGADPRLRRNRIHDAKESGVLVYNNGLGTLEDNEISSNANAGVHINTGGNPILRRNRIHDGRESGVFVSDDGLGTLEDNDISSNFLAGVEVRAGGNPTLRRNQIHDGRGSGVFVYDRGAGMLEDNDITSNTKAGVHINTRGQPLLRRNRIRDGKESGVLVSDDGGGILEDNDITGNACAGVEIGAGGLAVRHNRINRNKFSAVWIYQGGGGVFEDNDLSDNAQGAWDIEKGGKSRVSRTRNRG
jgi:F-box protein 11